MHEHSRPRQADIQPIITRAQAKALGLQRYFTGKPCKHGHVAERRVDNIGCIECIKLRNARRDQDYFKKWRQENKDKCRTYAKAYRERNPKAGAEYMKRVRKQRRDELLARERARYAERKEVYAEKRKKYQKQNPEYFAVAA